MRATLKPLADQTIVVTGASSGIGLVTARMAAKSGAAVVAAARNEAALRNLVHEIREGGGRAAYAVCDVGSEEDIAWVVAAADREFGGFDTWVNNAGISIFGKLWDVPMADWRRMFDTVYWGTVHGSLAAVRHFRDHDKAGAVGSLWDVVRDRRLNHRPEVISGVLADECTLMLQEFFATHRVRD